MGANSKLAGSKSCAHANNWRRGAPHHRALVKAWAALDPGRVPVAGRASAGSARANAGAFPGPPQPLHLRDPPRLVRAGGLARRQRFGGRSRRLAARPSATGGAGERTEICRKRHRHLAPAAHDVRKRRLLGAGRRGDWELISRAKYNCARAGHDTCRS